MAFADWTFAPPIHVEEERDEEVTDDETGLDESGRGKRRRARVVEVQVRSCGRGRL